MIQDPVAILAYLAALVAVVFQVSRIPALAPLFDRMPALVWTYFLPMLSTTVGILPAESPVYGALARYLLPCALALMLLSADLAAIFKLGRVALLVMAAGSLGTMLGAVTAYELLRGFLPEEAWKAFGALTATWIGGSANLVTVATTLRLSPELQGVMILIDTLVGYSYMGLLILLAPFQPRFDAWNRAERSVVDAIGAHLQKLRAKTARPIAVPDATLMVGFALGLTALCLQVGAWLPALGKVLNAYSWGVILVTTVAMLLSLTPLSKLEGAGASTLGYAGFYLLLASVGAQGDLRRVAEYPLFVLAGVIVIVIHATCTLLAVRWLRAPLLFYGAASQACVGGYSSAPVVAAIYHPAMAPLGLLLAVVGNLVGTYAGLLVAQLLAP